MELPRIQARDYQNVVGFGILEKNLNDECSIKFCLIFSSAKPYTLLLQICMCSNEYSWYSQLLTYLIPSKPDDITEYLTFFENIIINEDTKN